MHPLCAVCIYQACTQHFRGTTKLKYNNLKKASGRTFPTLSVILYPKVLVNGQDGVQQFWQSFEIYFVVPINLEIHIISINCKVEISHRTDLHLLGERVQINYHFNTSSQVFGDKVFCFPIRWAAECSGLNRSEQRNTWIPIFGIFLHPGRSCSPSGRHS